MEPTEFLCGVVVGVALAILTIIFALDGKGDFVILCIIGLMAILTRKAEKGKVDWNKDE